MSSFNFKFSLVVVVLSLSGCAAILYPTAENVLMFRGRVDTTESDCLLQLLETDGSLVKERAVAREFDFGMTVAPGRRRYFAELVCGPAHRRSQRYPVSTTEPIIDLGTVLIQPAPN